MNYLDFITNPNPKPNPEPNPKPHANPNTKLKPEPNSNPNPNGAKKHKFIPRYITPRYTLVLTFKSPEYVFFLNELKM